MPQNIFKISRVSGAECRFYYTAEVDAESYILKGHFEHIAIVPGVCTLTMLKQCVADALGRTSVTYSAIKECKFLATILPKEHRLLQVYIEFKGENGLVAEVLHDQIKMMKLRAEIDRE